jgi:hypothetical protein
MTIKTYKYIDYDKFMEEKSHLSWRELEDIFISLAKQAREENLRVAFSTKNRNMCLMALAIADLVIELHDDKLRVIKSREFL